MEAEAEAGAEGAAGAKQPAEEAKAEEVEAVPATAAAAESKQPAEETKVEEVVDSPHASALPVVGAGTTADDGGSETNRNS